MSFAGSITSKELKEIKGLNTQQLQTTCTECLGETDKHGYCITKQVFLQDSKEHHPYYILYTICSNMIISQLWQLVQL